MLIYLVVLLTLLNFMFLALPCIHTFQLEGYVPKQYLGWLENNRKKVYGEIFNEVFPALMIQVIAGLVYYQFIATDSASIWAVLVIGFVPMFGLALIRFIKWSKQPKKKELAYTARVKRLIGAMILFIALFCLLELGIVLTAVYDILLLDMIILELIIAAALPCIVLIADRMMHPIEEGIKRKYYNQARRQLEDWRYMTKIGITGSYGKTSCKNILTTILSEKFKTVTTPASYNTPMGVTRFVRESMSGNEEVFIAEMGARHSGDITQMCDLVHPQYGLITSIGAQHLETFGTVEAVAETKYELIKSLPEDGVGFFPADGSYGQELYERTTGQKVLFGFESVDGIPMVMARNIRSTSQGSSFDLVDEQGEQVECMTQLLGKHNVHNILGCCAVALRLGLTLDEISEGIGKIQPVEHRLQVIRGEGGVTVIDDAFNSNPAGFAAALEVLASFDGRKIIVTPGLVELGDKQYEENKLAGRRMANVVDHAILVAENNQAMSAGMEEGGASSENIHCVGSLTEATQVLATLTAPGDIVLFENDLPDHYEN